ncbi:MAG: DNA ligase [Aureispira sp.]|nr:DNA ligase [Aureispira sp.]
MGTVAGDSAVPHLFRMYSLQKFYKGEGSSPDTTHSTVETYKLDGAAISLLYVDRCLVQACTRGDGIAGQDITDKILVLKCVPNNILIKGVVQVIGEVVASKDITNSRNYASGALNLKTVDEFLGREVTFYAYGIEGEGSCTYYTEDLVLLGKSGFNTVLSLKIGEPIPFPNDGIVVRINSNSVFKDKGYTSKHPRGAWALKVRSKGTETTLVDVIWQVGKSGKVTPVAILDPINIEGAVVGRATLNNTGFIKGLNLKIGDKVLVERAGGIIPRIMSKAI